MAASQFAIQSNNQSFDISAASDFSNLESLLKELEDKGRTSPRTQLPVSKKEETPHPSSDAESVTPDSASPDCESPDATGKPEPSSPPPAESVTAISRCANAYNRAYRESKEKHWSEYESKKEAEHCYFNKIPTLDKPENVHDFIACVAYAMLLNIIPPADGTKILYAAQIATQAAQASQARDKIANRNKSTAETPK